MSRAHAGRARIATRVVHAGKGPVGEQGALVPPLPMSVVFSHGNPRGFAYGRDHNENWERLEDALSDLEEGQGAVVFGSGIAAISAVVESWGVGHKIVLAQDAYTGSRELLRHLSQAGRCTVELVDATNIEEVGLACQGAALLLIESLGNPLLTVADLKRCSEVAHQAGAITLVDNTFATPLLVQPLRLGADAVVHSVSKYIGGHSDLMLGVVVTNNLDLLPKLRYQRTNAGAIPGQLETWLALRGLRTLDVRLRRQTATAAFLAQCLQRFPGVLRVHYPGLVDHPQHELAARQMSGGFGAMLAVELDCDAETAESVCTATRIWTNATSLGSVESLLERRARWSGEEYLPAGLLRLSVGVEDADDLFQDLTQALAQAGLTAPASRESAGRPPAS
ncbi:MAG TPA: PLP-dependent transferase [Candidatus Dormibacteraeota bacterium]|nr:PLP-dependent transferase [Candidatus Dormibacteraeota bacterium]